MSFRMSRKKGGAILPNIVSEKPKDHVWYEDRENLFSNSVLIGNWFEKRFAHKHDQKAIAPSIYGNSNCVKDTSVYRSDYTQHIRMRSEEDYSDFIKWKQRGFHNRLNSEITNINLWNGDQFMKNLTTVKDLMYRIIPEQDVDYNVLRPTKRKSNYDLMNSYGNQTRTGLLQWRQCEKFTDDNTPIDASHYKNNFKAYKIETQKHRPKLHKKKTSI